MPSLKAIRNRIKSVKNTQKITKAMKLVAAAKLRRAQDAVVASRPYASRIRDVIGGLAGSVDPEAFPLFRRTHPPRKCLVIPITSDRGLAGAFNSSIIRRTELFLREQASHYDEIGLAPIGRKGRDHFRRRGIPVYAELRDLMTGPNQSSAQAVAKHVTRMFVAGEVDEVYLCFNEFKSALTQIVLLEPLLPLSAELFAGTGGATAEAGDIKYEPGRDQLLEKLLPRFVESQILRALLESQASEMGARMTAMDNASKNASELINAMTLQMNRARQAIITTELMEITSGAESLKG
jgi:F-type H+-transporting ATPase subunit gamma